MFSAAKGLGGRHSPGMILFLLNGCNHTIQDAGRVRSFGVISDPRGKDNVGYWLHKACSEL